MRLTSVAILLGLAAAVSNTYASTIYAASDQGLLSSSDAGRTWTINGSLGFVKVGAIGIDPSDPTRLFVAGGGDVFRTDNSGQSWARSEVPPSGPVFVIAVDPVAPDRLYAAGDALSISTDGGKQWRLASRLPVPFRDLAVDPLQPSTLYASAKGFGIFMSPNAGMHWEYVRGGQARLSLIIQDGVTYAYTGGPDGIYRTRNGGKDWLMVVPPPTLLELGMAAGFNWSGDIEVFDPVVTDTPAFAVDPTHSDRVYLALTTCVDLGFRPFCGTGILSRSATGWIPFHVEGDLATFVVAPDGQALFEDSSQILQSTNSGRDWASLRRTQASSPAIAVVGDDPRITAIRNAAWPEFEGPVAPGSIISIFGKGIASPSLPRGKTSVLVNGSAVSLLYVSPEQINAVLPVGILTGRAELEIQVGTRKSLPTAIGIVRSAPALFSIDGSGYGLGVFVHAITGKSVTASTPAVAGEAILAFSTGVGDSPSLRATVGNLPAAVDAITPSAEVTGVDVIRIIMPNNVPRGMQPLQLLYGNFSSNVVEIPCESQ